MQKKLVCVSCRKELVNDQGSVVFECPKCGKGEIVRCFDCRRLAAKYTCGDCGFSGPN